MSSKTASTTKQPEISPLDWAGDPQLCPKWVGFPTRAGLPAGLIWSGSGAVPAIGEHVHLCLNGFGPAEVKAYFHADGYLGVVCAPDELPAWFRQQKPGVTLGHFFGRELDAFRPMRAAAAAPSEAEQLAQWSEAVDQAHEANGNNPAINDPGDWIPDYPPQAEDEADDPEHSQGEHFN